MDKDLALRIGNRYTITLVVFFIPYLLFEVRIRSVGQTLIPPLTKGQLPSNIVLRRVGSANWLAAIALGWGTVMLGQVNTK
jgi:hypothetical protein